MIKSVLENIGGVGIYGVISICIFFAFFAGVLLWASRLKKSHLNSASTLPLEDGTTSDVAQTSKSAVSRVSKPADRKPLSTPPIWKSATQQVWKPALPINKSEPSSTN